MGQLKWIIGAGYWLKACNGVASGGFVPKWDTNPILGQFLLLTLHFAGARKSDALPSVRLGDLYRTGGESLVALHCEESRPGGRSYKGWWAVSILQCTKSSLQQGKEFGRLELPHLFFEA